MSRSCVWCGRTLMADEPRCSGCQRAQPVSSQPSPVYPPSPTAPFVQPQLSGPPTAPQPNTGRIVAIVIASFVGAWLLVAVVCIVAITFLGQRTSSESVASDPVAQTGLDPGPGGGRDYPVQVRRNFMATCTLNAAQAQCSCLLERIEEEYTLEEFIELERQIVNSGQPTAIVPLLRACASGG